MQIELKRKDLINLLRGCEPNYNIMSEIPSDLGYYSGGFCDEWHWTLENIHEYSDEYIYNLYVKCKNSWK